MANYKEYVIESGDTLTKIANQFDTTIDALVELNNIADPDLIYAGDTLKIPVEVDEAAEKLKAAKAEAEAKAAAKAKEEAKEEEKEDKNLFAKIADKLKK